MLEVSSDTIENKFDEILQALIWFAQNSESSSSRGYAINMISHVFEGINQTKKRSSLNSAAKKVIETAIIPNLIPSN